MDSYKNYISQAFKSLEDLDIMVESVKLVEEETDDKFEKGTLGSLLKEAGSYATTQTITIDGIDYLIYIEAICDDDKSCDATFDIFDMNNVSKILIGVMNDQHEFLGEIKGLNIYNTLDEAIAKIKTDVLKTEEKVDSEDAKTEEEPEANKREFVSNEEVEVKEPIDEPKESPVDVEKVGVDKDNDDVEIKYKDKRITVSNESLKEDKSVTVNVSGNVNVDTGDICIKKKKCKGECDKDEPIDSELTESKKFDITDKKDIEDAEEFIDKKEDTDTIEQIVDIDAEAVSDLKKSYIGSAILECPVCTTKIYKDIDALKQDESNKDLFNVGDECPHCGAKDGFKLIGQVATLDVNPEAKSEAPIEPETKEIEVKDEEETTMPTLDGEVEKEEEITVESLDEQLFDKLVRKYLNETYSNIKSYTTTSGSMSDKNNTIVIEGKITFKSGKEKATKFIFEAKEITKKGKIKLVGLNETFSNKKAFTLLGSIQDKGLLTESLSYSYKIGDKKIKGKKII